MPTGFDGMGPDYWQRAGTPPAELPDDDPAEDDADIAEPGTPVYDPPPPVTPPPPAPRSGIPGRDKRWGMVVGPNAAGVIMVSLDFDETTSIKLCLEGVAGTTWTVAYGSGTGNRTSLLVPPGTYGLGGRHITVIIDATAQAASAHAWLCEGEPDIP